MKRLEYICSAKRLWIAFSALLASMVILSCSWDPIFYNISMEQAPRTAAITGSPQNMVITKDRLYAWTLRGNNVWHFSYSEIGLGEDAVSEWRWHRMENTPGHPIGGLAAVELPDGTGYHLYAVVYPGNNPARSEIWGYSRTGSTSNGQWRQVQVTPVDGSSITDYSIGHLHSAGGEIFARAQLSSNLEVYAILHFSPDMTTGDLQMQVLELESSDASINLRGAAYRDGQIYLATTRQIFTFAGGGLTPFITDTSDFDITGITATGNDIVVVGNASNAGRIHVFGSAGGATWADSLKPSPSGVFFNGGMSVWQEFYLDNWRPRLLLLGVRTNSHNVNGYREIDLLSDGNVAPSLQPPFLSSPGNQDVSSVRSNSIYRANIGTRSVRFIQQVPNLHRTLSSSDDETFFPRIEEMENEFRGWQPPIFASTSRDGLWAYNFRNDRWNADNNRINWLAPTYPDAFPPCQCTDPACECDTCECTDSDTCTCLTCEPDSGTDP